MVSLKGLRNLILRKYSFLVDAGFEKTMLYNLAVIFREERSEQRIWIGKVGETEFKFTI